MSKSPVRVAVTGAAGQIGYAILFRIASGEMLGKDQPVFLQLLEIPDEKAQKALKGVMMELEDCAFPLLAGMQAHSDPMTAFTDTAIAMLVGARPRGPGMERKDLLAANAQIFTAQGKALNVAATLVALPLVDRWGRRPLLLLSLAGMAGALAMFGGTLAADGGSGLSLVCLVAFILSFELGIGPIFWLLIAEIYPLRVRGLAMGVATTANWAANLLVSLTFLTFTDRFGPSLTFWLYAMLTVGALIFAYRLVPETKGRTLEAIEAFWHGAHEQTADAGPPDADHLGRAA